MNKNILNKLDKETRKWYMESDECDILSALLIGKELITSSYYKSNKDTIVCTMKNELEEYNNRIEKLKEEFKLEKETIESDYNRKLNKERLINEQLSNKFNIDNRDSINIAVEHSLKYANDNIELLRVTNSELNEKLEKYMKIKEEYDNFKCNINKSKIKGELSESEVKRHIEEAGFLTEKPGINSGDLFVYSKSKELICVLEIKNYGSSNKHKLGINGSEIKKLYKDIETQLSGENKINVPWLFISLGCEIPNMESLRDNHCGVPCIYLSEPSYKEMIECIRCSGIINKLNSSKNNKNEIYIESKINEIYDIFLKFSKCSPNFKKMRVSISKSLKEIDKEEEKFNKSLEENMGKVYKIFDNINRNNYRKKTIDYDKDISKLSLNNIVDYISELKDHCKLLESVQLNKGA